MRPIAVWTLWSQAPAADGPSSNTTAQTFAMKNSYKVVVKSNQGNAKTVTHDVPAPGSWWGALKIKAVPGARYQLIDNTTGQGPDNIRVKRAGNDLRISFDGREDADLVISDYYEYTEPGFAALIGEADPGVFHAYLPESGQTSALVGNLPDGASNVGMALGGEQVGASGAAVGALVAVAGFNPLLAAPLALLGAGGGGGGGADGASGTGGGGVPDTTPPVISAARLAPEDDTGVSNSDGITADNTPRLLITADADAVSATVTLMNGKTYTSTTKNAQGQFVVQIPDADALGNGQVKYSVVVKDAAGNTSQLFSGTPFVVDRLSEALDPSPSFNLTKMTQSEFDFDKDDFLTNQSRPEFDGTITNYNADTQKLLVQVVGITGTTLDYAYITPNSTTGAWVFKPSIDLAGNNDQYLLKATLVDNAGNILKAWDQSFGVDRVVPTFKLAFNGSSDSLTWGDPVTARSSEFGRYWASAEANKISTSFVSLTDASNAEGEFSLGFWDLAGNASKTLTSSDNPQTANVVDPWEFASEVEVVNLKQPGLNELDRTPKTFGSGALADSVGTLQFTPGQATELNVTGLYKTNPAVNSVAAINHIKMNDDVGNDTLKLTMGDVLALGVKDSFVSNGHRQMRIDGDEYDKVLLDNLVGSSSDQTWSQQPNQLSEMPSYNLYSNTYWGLDLFIKQGIEVL